MKQEHGVEVHLVFEKNVALVCEKNVEGALGL